MENAIQENKKESLSLKPVLGKEGLLVGQKSDGKKYTVREDRRRYFFPGEWIEFINLVKKQPHRFFFMTCLHTGGRAMEILNLKHKDINLDRETIIFNTVKRRAAKKGYSVTGKSRSFFVASNFIKEYKSFIRTKKIDKEDYIFLDNEKLPENYEKLSNKEKRKYFNSKKISYSGVLKRKLKKASIKDWYNFSLHNLRKTYGMWMRTFNKEIAELCYRMGHDQDTYLAHYGSSLIFTDSDRRLIEKIFGDVK